MQDGKSLREWAIERAFKDYNEYRPHSSINYLPPRELRWKFPNDSTFRKRYE
jgi:putative transposase